MASAAAQAAEPQTATPLEIEAILQDRSPGKVAWKSDLSEMRQRRLIRVLVPNNRTFFFYDGLQPRSLAYEFMTEFVDKLNAGKSTNARLYLMFLPSAWDRFIPDIVNGYCDVAIAGLTVTASREKAVAFISYDLTMNEIVVTGANAPALGSVEALAGRKVFVLVGFSAALTLVAYLLLRGDPIETSPPEATTSEATAAPKSSAESSVGTISAAQPPAESMMGKSNEDCRLPIACLTSWIEPASLLVHGLRIDVPLSVSQRIGQLHVESAAQDRAPLLGWSVGP